MIVSGSHRQVESLKTLDGGRVGLSWGELVQITNSTPPIFKVGGPNIKFVIFRDSTKLTHLKVLFFIS